MKRYNLLYYLLIVLLIMGAFASMAQNSYGMKLLAAVSIIFGLLFLAQLGYQLRRKEGLLPDTIIELSALTLVSFVLPLRLFHARFPYSELIISIAAIALAIVYALRLLKRYLLYKPGKSLMAFLVLLFYSSIVLFSLAIAIIFYLPRPATYAGIAAFVLLLIFLVIGFIKRRIAIDGENVSAFSVIAHFKDQSLLLASLFFIFSVYIGFTRSGVLPKLYSDQFPQAYFEMINKAESGTEIPVNDRYKHELFKESYDQFLEKNISNRKK